jgi:putative membrane protein
MVKPASFLTVEERERVRAAVAEAELKSAGEIRVLIVGRSAPWSWLAGALCGLAAGSAAFAVQHAASWGHPGAVEALSSTAAALGVTALGAWLIPPGRAAKDRATWDRAKREFERLGIAKTEGATGVLVMISLRERLAVVLADKAINSKVAPDTWSREVKILLDGVKAGRPGEGIAAAVAEIGALLAKHFPRREGDINELPDDVETR